MDAWLVNTLVFLAAFMMVVAANAVVLDLSARERRRLDQELRDRLHEQRRERVRSQDLSQVARMDDAPKSTLWQTLRSRVEQSGVDISAGRLVLFAVVLAIVAGGLCGGLTWNLPLTALAAFAGGALPPLYVLYARHQRLERLLAQLPDAFELMSRVLRAGQTISQAMQLVASEFSQPLSLEFFHCHEQMNLGLSPEAALQDLARRTGLLEIKIFAVAVLVQRQTGGNLSELFDKMSTVVRERFRIRGMIQSLTAQGRMQAAILLSLPPAMFVFLMVIKPDYELVLLQYPLLIATALGMMALGALWVHRVIHFDF